ncbi:MAG TPA: hypothetical protein VLJ68_10405 [Chitinophagaceae bacterium]|nr:hypothetical protein [Chitinophagaceae bacterium]
MGNSIKQSLKEEYRKLKKAFEKILNADKKKTLPQPAWQPIRNKKIF